MTVTYPNSRYWTTSVPWGLVKGWRGEIGWAMVGYHGTEQSGCGWENEIGANGRRKSSGYYDSVAVIALPSRSGGPPPRAYGYQARRLKGGKNLDGIDE